MSFKEDNCMSVILNKKKTRKIVTLDIKLDVIDRFKDGNRAVDIARDLGLQSSTVRTIRRNADKITLSAQSVTALSAARLSRNRSVIMEKMETLLINWIEEQHQLNLSVSLKAIQDKALALFGYLKHQLGDSAKNEKFSASRGWFERFKRRSNLHNSQVQDISTPIKQSSEKTKLKEIISKIIVDGGYTPHQVFSVHKTILFWKRLPVKRHFAQNKFLPKFSKEHVNLLLGGNAAGDVKLKPLMVYQDKTPGQMENYSKAYYPVLMQSSETSQITKTMIEKWFTEYFCPTIEDYCHKNNLNPKVLLIIENVPDHPPNLDDSSHNVQVVFLSTGSSNHESSMGHAGTSTFKTLYTQYLLKQSLEFVEGSTKEDFWKTYNLTHAIDNIAHVWQEVKMHELIHTWQNIWPDLCDVNLNELNQLFKETQEEGITLSQQAVLGEVEMEDVVGLVQKEGGRFFHKDLVLITQKEEADWRQSQNINPSYLFSTTDLEQAFDHLSKAMDIFANKDPQKERSDQVNRAIKNGFSCYEDLYKKMKNICS